MSTSLRIYYPEITYFSKESTMRPENTEAKKNQVPRFAKAVILLAPCILVVAGATMYRESKSNSPSATSSASTTRSEPGIQVNQPLVQGEPFSQADGVNFISPGTAPLKKVQPSVAAPVGAQAYSAAGRQSVPERLDHSVVNQRSTAHESDLPGASIAAY